MTENDPSSPGGEFGTYPNGPGHQFHNGPTGPPGPQFYGGQPGLQFPGEEPVGYGEWNVLSDDSCGGCPKLCLFLFFISPLLAPNSGGLSSGFQQNSYRHLAL